MPRARMVETQRGAALARGAAVLGLLVLAGVGIGAGRPSRVQRPAAVDQLLVDASSLLVIAFIATGTVIVVWTLWPDATDEKEVAVKGSMRNVLVAVLAITAILLLMLHFRRSGSSAQPAGAGAPPTSVVRRSGRAPVHQERQPRWTGIAVASTVLLAGGGVVAVRALRRSGTDGAPIAGDVVPEPLHVLAAVSLDALDAEPDDRAAVLAAHAAMEMVLASEGLGRHPWETAHEHVQRALADLGASAPVVLGLTDLFTVARYSSAPLAADARAQARQGLQQLTRRFAPA